MARRSSELVARSSSGGCASTCHGRTMEQAVKITAATNNKKATINWQWDDSGYGIRIGNTAVQSNEQ